MCLVVHFGIANSAANTTSFRIYKQAPNAATVDQRQAQLVELGLTERNVNGRVQTFRFDNANHSKPAKLSTNCRSLGVAWQEWEFGIGGNLPAKLLHRDKGLAKKMVQGDRSKLSRRLPIFLLLESLIRFKGCMPAEAFRRVEKEFPRMTMGGLAVEVRRRGPAGTLRLRCCMFPTSSGISLHPLLE